MQERRSIDPILMKMDKKIDRIDGTLHGNGKMGLKTRVFLLWYGAWGLIIVAGILAGCYFKG